MYKSKRVISLLTALLLTFVVGLTVCAARRQVRLVPRAQQTPAPTTQVKISDKVQSFFQSNPQGKMEVLAKLTLPQKLEDNKHTSISKLRQNRAQFIAERQKLADATQQKVLGLLTESIKNGDIELLNKFWIVNILHLKANKKGLDTISQTQDVLDITENGEVFIPKPQPVTSVQPKSLPIEWNITKIQADRVWNELHITGEGKTVAGLDTGVIWTHPALKQAYRGWDEEHSSVDHNYNWYDATQPTPPPEPYDDDYTYYHGTHITGTMVGAEGNINQVGVAPGAKWIAVKIVKMYSGNTTSDTAILAGMQWLLEPKRLDPNDPHPDPAKAPDVVNNSWGRQIRCNETYREAVQAWINTGIVPVFANGNGGPGPNTVSSPADYPESIGVGATDSSDQIAYFSSRGLSCFGETKPEISAPGVDIRSSSGVSGGYAQLNGTSMAAPHVAGLVALLLSANPDLAIIDLERIIEFTSLDLGNSGPDNNYGFGRINAFDAVQLAQNLGTLSGRVTSSGQPLPSATIRISNGQKEWPILLTDTDGRYTTKIGAGTNQITFSKFGYEEITRSVDIAKNQLTTLDIELTPMPSYTLGGRVTKKNGVISPAQATITLLNTPLSVQTDADGRYIINNVPVGTYEIKVTAPNCFPLQRSVALSSDTTADFLLSEYLLLQDFETGFGSWIGKEYWRLDDGGCGVTPHDGSLSATYSLQPIGLGTFACQYVGYGNTLTSPIFHVPAISDDVEMTFWEWHKTHTGLQRLIQVKEDTSTSWITLIQLPEDPVEIWNQISLNLNQFRGKNIQIRFNFINPTPFTPNSQGWYIDDILILRRKANFEVRIETPANQSYVSGNVVFKVATLPNPQIKRVWVKRLGGDAIPYAGWIARDNRYADSYNPPSTDPDGNYIWTTNFGINDSHPWITENSPDGTYKVKAVALNYYDGTIAESDEITLSLSNHSSTPTPP